jgi:hypothetical protein
MTIQHGDELRKKVPMTPDEASRKVAAREMTLERILHVTRQRRAVRRLV